MQLTQYKRKKRECELCWNDLAIPVQGHDIDKYTQLIVSEIAQHLLDKSGSKLVKIGLRKHFCNHINQLCMLLNASPELPESAMMNLNQVY
jgi:hypothetical protein